MGELEDEAWMLLAKEWEFLADFEAPRLNDCLERLAQMALILAVSLLWYFEERAAMELMVIVALMA